MRIGVPKEIKDDEDRVGMVPGAVRELVGKGDKVLVQHDAGKNIGLTNEDYVAAGAKIVPDADAVWGQAEMIVKVKEPLAVERKKLRADQLLFTYLHLAPDPAQAQDLIASGATCIAYETVTSPAGTLPLLQPMSEVAGRMSVQVGAQYFENAYGGPGMLPGGVARTSTFALNNATLPYIVALAGKGWKRALADDKHLRDGLNVQGGAITPRSWRRAALGLNLKAVEQAFAA